MLKSNPRYSTPGAAGGVPTSTRVLRLESHSALEAAVDLSRKPASGSSLKSEVDVDPDESEDEAPLDLKVSLSDQRKCPSSLCARHGTV